MCIRMFDTVYVRGQRNYIKTQKVYEVIRTVIYFAIPISLFVAGYIMTGRRTNLLTVVAVLGCLPASRSLVSCIMFFQFHSCSKEVADRVWWHCRDMGFLYDCVFTSSKRNYFISHMAIRANTVVGFSEDKDFPEKDFYEHIENLFAMHKQPDVTVKIFTDLNKYERRLMQMNKLTEDEMRTASVMVTLMDGCL